jgi:hypothetical protein
MMISSLATQSTVKTMPNEETATFDSKPIQVQTASRILRPFDHSGRSGRFALEQVAEPVSFTPLMIFATVSETQAS